jgi:hypothetical protein
MKNMKSWEVVLTRREALRLGGILVASSWMGPKLAEGEGETREGGGTVVALEGLAWVDGRGVRLGERVLAGEVVKGAPNASVVLRFPDNSLVKLKGEFEFRVGKAERSSVWALIKGALLAIVMKKSRYSLSTPTAVLGVRGTVFFYEVLRKRALSRGSASVIPVMGRPPSPPPDAAEYFCLCNGSAVSSSLERKPDKEIVSQYHTSFFVYPERDGLRLVPAFLWNHTDREILDLVKHQESPQHDMEWIYRAWRESGGTPGTY